MRHAFSTALLCIVLGSCTNSASIWAATPKTTRPAAVPKGLNPLEAKEIPRILKDRSTQVVSAAEESSAGVKQASSQLLDSSSQRVRSLIAATGKDVGQAEKTQSGGTDGTYYGTSVSERMADIRRRAADIEVSHSSQATDEAVSRESEKGFRGELPEVPRRVITETALPVSELMPEPMTDPMTDGKSIDLSRAAESTGTNGDTTVRQAPTVEVSEQYLDGVAKRKASMEGAGAVPARQKVILPTRPIPQSQSATKATPWASQPQRSVESPHPQGPEILLSKRAPSLSFETAGPRTISVGKEASYRISIVNTGEVDAKNLIVTVSVPPWAEVTRQKATIGHARLDVEPQEKSLIRWDVGKLPANGREYLTVRVIPRESRPFDLAVGWIFSPGDSLAQIEVQEPLLEMSIDGPPEVLYGDTKTYLITLHNPGTGDAENVVLNLLPVTPSQQSAGARRVGTLKAGERKQIELELTAQEAGQLEVKAQAYADGGLRSEGICKVLVRRARLRIAVAGPPMKYAGTPAAYKIRMENTGDAAAEKVFVTATLPPATRFVSATEGGVYDEETGSVVWPIGTMGARASRLCEMECVLMRGGENQFTFDARDDGGLQITDTLVTSVESLADLKLYVDDPRGPVPVGSDAVYKVTVVNRGTKAAENVQITGYFSRGIEPVAIQSWRGDIDKGQVAFEPIGRLNAGQELVFQVVARADRPGNHVFRAEVECAAPETRLAAEEWTKYYNDDGHAFPQQARGDSLPAPLTREPSVGFRR